MKRFASVLTAAAAAAVVASLASCESYDGGGYASPYQQPYAPERADDILATIVSAGYPAARIIGRIGDGAPKVVIER